MYWNGLGNACEEAAALGFDAVELFFQEPRSVNVAEVQAALAGHNLSAAAFGSGAGWVKHKLRLTDPDARMRRRAVERGKEVGPRFALEQRGPERRIPLADRKKQERAQGKPLAAGRARAPERRCDGDREFRKQPQKT